MQLVAPVRSQPLGNVRWESYCQAIAQGMKPADAYVMAGYKSQGRRDDGKKGRELPRRHPEIAQRIAFLNLQKERPDNDLSIDPSWVESHIRKIVQQGMDTNRPAGLGVALRGLELLGVQRGMFVRRSERLTETDNPQEGKTPAELAKALKSLVRSIPESHRKELFGESGRDPGDADETDSGGTPDLPSGDLPTVQ